MENDTMEVPGFVRGLSTKALVIVLMAGCSAAPSTPGGTGYVNQYSGGSFGSGGALGSGGAVVTNSGGSILGGSGGAVGTGTGGAPAVATTSDLPCDVQAALQTNCWNCHGSTPNFSAPMSLVTQADFLAMGKVTTISVVRDLAKTRINATTNQMPPPSAPPMSAQDLATLNQWLDAGTPVGDGSSCTPMAGTGGVIPVTGGAMGTGGAIVNPGDPYADAEPWSTAPGWPGGVAPQETCYQFLKHGANTPGDTSPMVTPNGEFYVTFYYQAPWTENSVITKWRTVYDQTQILHHWLLYTSTAATSKAGTFDDPLPTSNLLAGAHTTAGDLVTGWAVGGKTDHTPEGIGLKTQPPGGMFELEWHLWNSTGGDVADNSGIELCVVPESAVDPKNIAAINWLGTEQLVLAPSTTTTCSGTCTPSFGGGAPATIIMWIPHMHLKGIHMDTWLTHSNGMEEHVFDKPFQFDFQISHHQDPPVVVNQGDTLRSACTFDNPTSSQVLFGQSTNSEMCYQFVISYPAGSLTGVSGTEKVLTGAFNGCGLSMVPANPCQ